MILNKYTATLRDGSFADIAAAKANSQIWQKVMAIPSVLEIEGLTNASFTDGSTEDMKVSGSLASPRIFQYQVPADKFLLLAEVNMVIVDAGVAMNRFGGQTALANGLLWRVVDSANNVKYNFRNAASPVIQSNADFFNVAGGSIAVNPGDDSVTVQWRPGTVGVIALLKNSDKIQIIVRDNLSAMSSFKAHLFGRLMPMDFVAQV